MSDKIIEITEEQTNTILTILVNLYWHSLRKMLDWWTDYKKNPDIWTVKEINDAQKLVDDFQELESIIKGVPIK